MKRQTIIVILTVLILVGIVHANPYTKDKQDNVWEERFQQIIAQQEIQKEEYEKLKKSATQEVFYREYGSVSKSEETGIVTVENAGIFSIKVKGPEILKAVEKAVLTFYIGNMFKRGYFELEDYIDEMIDSTKVGLMKDGLLSFIVPQEKIYVDYNNIEIKKFLYDGAILPGNRKTPMKLIKKDNMQTTDPDNLIAYLEEWYFKVHKEETLGRYEEAMKKTIENAVSAVIGKVKGKIISEIAKKTTPAVGIAYTLGEISWPLINALLEDITENKIAIEKSKLDLLKILAKDRNEYNIFDIPIVLNEKIIGTEDPIMAMIITIPIEVKEIFEPGDKMGFYFDGCLGEKQELERSEYYEWDLNEWGSLSRNDPVEENLSGDYARIEYEVNIDEEITEKSESEIISDTIGIMRKRLDYFEYKNISVQKVLRDRSSIIRIDIPLNEYSVEDCGVIERIISKRGEIYFGEILDMVYSDTKPAKKLGIAYTDSTWLKARDIGYDVDRWYLVREYAQIGSRKLYLDGTFLETVNTAPDTQRGGFKIQFSFEDEGAYIFEMLTANFFDKQIPIVLDDIVLVAPVVQAVIRDGSAEIQGSFAAGEADEIAAILKSKSLPFSLIKLTEEVIEKQ